MALIYAILVKKEGSIATGCNFCVQIFVDPAIGGFNQNRLGGETDLLILTSVGT